MPLKANVDAALKACPSVKDAIVVKVTGGNVPMQEGRDHDYAALCAAASPDCPAEPMNAEDPLFILYTSGSTGKPKGVLHTTGGYLVWASFTHELVFNYRPGDIYWCTADVGWVTGHTYILYGPLANGATTLMFEGIPNYPDSSRFWQVVDKHKVNIFYTAPTAIRSLMRDGEEPVRKTSRASLRLLGSVGEPINPEAWLWYHRVVGEGRCPVVDTWWQTETGGILISPLPGATVLKPGSATLPLPGVKPLIVDGEGNELLGATEGNLCLSDSWPGQMRTVFGDHARFVQTYFSTYKGLYFTGDGARRDSDGYYWITGRVDDVINVSGHRMGTAEVESALVAAPEGSGSGGGRLPARPQGPGHLCLRHPGAERGADRGVAQGIGRLGAQGDWPDRHAGCDPVGARPPEDPQRQDHAPHPAQDCRERDGQFGGHLDLGRSGGGDRVGGEPGRVGAMPRTWTTSPRASFASRSPASVHGDAVVREVIGIGQDKRSVGPSLTRPNEWVPRPQALAEVQEAAPPGQGCGAERPAVTLHPIALWHRPRRVGGCRVFR